MSENPLISATLVMEISCVDSNALAYSTLLKIIYLLGVISKIFLNKSPKRRAVNPYTLFEVNDGENSGAICGVNCGGEYEKRAILT